MTIYNTFNQHYTIWTLGWIITWAILDYTACRKLTLCTKEQVQHLHAALCNMYNTHTRYALHFLVYIKRTQHYTTCTTLTWCTKEQVQHPHAALYNMYNTYAMYALHYTVSIILTMRYITYRTLTLCRHCTIQYV